MSVVGGLFGCVVVEGFIAGAGLLCPAAIFGLFFILPGCFMFLVYLIA
jgi:hypothetical protein